MKKTKYIFATILATFSIAVAPLATTQGAVDIEDAQNVTKAESCKNVKNCSNNNALASIFRTVSNVVLFLVGAVAVIMLIIGGFRYVASNGDPNITKGARDTILYAIIGIVIAFLAYAAVNFIVSALTGNAKTP